jgi:hypothetical protein
LYYIMRNDGAVVTRKSAFNWVLLAAFLVLSACVKAQGTQLDYSPKLDSICAVISGPSIEETWKSELQLTLPEFEKEWATLGVELVKGSERVLGRAINQNFTAHLTLCNTPSRAWPVVVNMRYALKSFTPSPVPLRVKVGTLHHEILHREIDELIPSNSPFLEDYSDEHSRVRNHLHLLAVQKATYLELGLDDELAELVSVDSRLPEGYYKRAWEIVNSEPQHYKKALAELQQREG